MTILPSQTKKISQEVDVSDKEQLKEVLDLSIEMTELCKKPLGEKKNGALALAHCQVDHDNPKRFFVALNGEVFINPKILSKQDSFTHIEGCMSYPFRGQKKVKRWNKVQVEYINSEGETVIDDVEGINACIFQHEIAHMNGISIYT